MNVTSFHCRSQKMSAYNVLFIVIFSTVLLCCHTSNAGPARQLALAGITITYSTFLWQKDIQLFIWLNFSAARASKIPRTIRAPFRNTEMMTARGFGKRRLPGSRSNEEGFLSSEVTGESDPVQQVLSDQSAESFPIEWFANGMHKLIYFKKIFTQTLSTFLSSRISIKSSTYQSVTTQIRRLE